MIFSLDRKIFFSVLVAALGYFVDVYDLVVFGVVRVASLKDLGIEGAALTETGALLQNIQMAGMLLGGFLWGIYGDKKGRLAILFGSILLYSVANIANAFVINIPQYALCRFIAGIGLAGEIGAGITLVSELLPKDKRGIGTTIVAGVGVAGGLTAALVGDFFPWQTAYIIGGIMGLALLILRVSVAESGLFEQMGKKNVRRGDLGLLFRRKDALGRFACCILIGMPLWFIVGVILLFSPEIGQELGIAGGLTTAGSILYFYSGLVIGDLGSGFVSQALKSRKKVLAIFILGSFAGTMLLLHPPTLTAQSFYWIAGLTGVFAGYWAVFLTTTAEHFGTNLRATVTTSVPNLVRGGSIITLAAFKMMKDYFGIIPSLQLLAVIVFSLALFALYKMRETFGTDLNYTER